MQTHPALRPRQRLLPLAIAYLPVVAVGAAFIDGRLQERSDTAAHAA